MHPFLSVITISLGVLSTVIGVVLLCGRYIEGPLFLACGVAILFVVFSHPPIYQTWEEYKKEKHCVAVRRAKNVVLYRCDGGGEFLAEE